MINNRIYKQMKLICSISNGIKLVINDTEYKVSIELARWINSNTGIKVEYTA